MRDPSFNIWIKGFISITNTKIFSVRPDVVELQTYNEEPMFNLIIGFKKLTKYGIVLDFGTKVVTIDQIQSPMKPINAFKRSNFGTRLSREELEPISTQEETKITIKILYANYKKADIPTIVKENFNHLDLSQKNKLLRLLIDYE